MEESSDPPDSPGASPGARVVARVVDPLVREDGRGDPQVTLRTEPARAAHAEAASRAPSSSGHPVRDRLLAKARAASDATLSATAAGGSAAPSQASAQEPTRSQAPQAQAPGAQAAEARAAEAPGAEPLGFSSLPELADDLDLIGAPERERAPRPEPSAAALSSPAALLLGTLFGVALMAVLFATLIQISPRSPMAGKPPPSAAAPLARPSPSPSPVADTTVRRPPRKRVEGPWRIAQAARDPQFKHVQGKVGARSFLVAAQAVGIDLREAYRVLTAFEGLKDLDRCRPRDTFSALLEPSSGRLSAFEYTVSEEEIYQARESEEGLLVGQKLDLKVRRDRVQGVVVLDADFDTSALAAGFEPGLGRVLDKALAGYSSVADLKRGDVLALVAQEVTVLGEFSRYAGVEALEYRSAGADPVRIYYHESPKSRGYVDSKGQVIGKSRWARPVPGAAVTSRFNPKRVHPILKRVKPHNGTDFGAPPGTPVVASAAGKLSFVGKAGPNGNMITLQHSGGYQTGYSHLSRFAKGLKAGQRVKQKQVIGYVGSTGRSTGPHLHFSAKKNGRFIDPESLNLDAYSRLAFSDRGLLSALRRRYDQLLDSLHIPEPSASASPEPAPAATVQAALLPQLASSAVAAERPAPSGLSIYLSDKELMQRQPATHAGEVSP